MSLNAAADLGDTLVGYNVAGSSPDCSGTINSSDYNLIQNTAGATIGGATAHNLLGLDPRIGALADNGGLSPTMAPLAGSPAIDQGKSFGIATDQRGAPRPFDFAAVPDAVGGDASDIGAFETGQPRLVLQASGGAVVLSWPAWYGDFFAQSVTNVAGSNTWVAVPGMPTVSANRYLLTNSPISGARFFRLQAK